MPTEKRVRFSIPLAWTHAEGVGGWASALGRGDLPSSDTPYPHPPGSTQPASFGEMIWKNRIVLFHCVLCVPCLSWRHDLSIHLRLKTTQGKRLLGISYLQIRKAKRSKRKSDFSQVKTLCAEALSLSQDDTFQIKCPKFKGELCHWRFPENKSVTERERS